MIIGRKYEIELLQRMKRSKKAELIILYGRRRVGKSFLLEQITQNGSAFYFEAIKGLSLQDQITHFLSQIEKKINKRIPSAKTWQEAFDIFSDFLLKGNHVVVFDEFPWMCSEKKELVAILKFYWDRKWKKNSGLKLILCGSVANFMIKHLVHSEALHNRKTLEIHLDPLPSNEAIEFFKGKRSLFEITKFLMIFGGIPKYLEQIDPNESLENNLDRLSFTKHGFFISEFETIFKEQFKTIRRYEKIVELLSRNKLSKEELQHETNSGRGGSFSTSLHQLEMAGFIIKEPSLSFGDQAIKTRTIRYILSDEWLRFYFRYIKKNLTVIKKQTALGLSSKILGKSFSNYLGLTFELFCKKNISQVLKYLNIEPTSVIEIGPYFKQGSRLREENGVQIDLCLKRKGHILTIIECKFSEKKVGVEIISEIEEKIKNMKIPHSFSVEKVLISANGISLELEERDYFHKVMTIEDFY